MRSLLSGTSEEPANHKHGFVKPLSRIPLELQEREADLITQTRLSLLTSIASIQKDHF